MKCCIATKAAAPRYCSAAIIRALLCCAAANLVACAFTAPPYPAPSPPPPCPAPSLTLVEGQPRGLLLTLDWTHPLPDSCPAEEASLILLRQTLTADDPEPPWVTLQELPLHADPRPARFLDAPEAPADLRYLLTLARPDGTLLASAPVLQARWDAPPAPPQLVQAEALGPHILLQWTSTPDLSAVVFRRDLAAQTPFTRLTDPLPEGTGDFADTTAAPGHVYAYIVSRVRLQRGVPMFGPPSPEVYIEAEEP